MRSLTATLKCLKCNAVYDAPYVKFRLNFHSRTYERCACCGRWAWHKEGRHQGPLSEKEGSETRQ